jgi:hypothetical protein
VNKEKILYDVLFEHGFKLIRRDRHEIWQNGSGLQVILSCSPSDQHWAAMALRDLRRKLAGHYVRGISKVNNKNGGMKK